MSRPAPAEWPKTDEGWLALPPGTPLLLGGRQVVSMRDASMWSRPDVSYVKAQHAAVTTERIMQYSGTGATVVAACQPTRILLIDDLGCAEVTTADRAIERGRSMCRSRACWSLFAQTSQEG